jgi:hypothetical protein
LHSAHCTEKVDGVTDVTLSHHVRRKGADASIFVFVAERFRKYGAKQTRANECQESKRSAVARPQAVNEHIRIDDDFRQQEIDLANVVKEEQDYVAISQ